ncbi:MAG: signal peptidase II [Patescibacteria group bacterium]|nr:signal peptidase II [Patescibacteria group bacterium]
MLKKYFLFGLPVIFFFIADRFLKYWFTQNPSAKIGGGFIIPFLDFKLVPNYGVAFGILFNQTAILFFVIVILIVLIFWLVDFIKQLNWFSVFSLSLIIAGAISNLLDRLHYGFVVDYIDVTWFTVFNLADAMITFGVFLLLLATVKSKNNS